MVIPWEFFSKRVLYAKCPECGLYRPDHFAGDQPSGTTCTNCTATLIESHVKDFAWRKGYPLATQGPCTKCFQPCYRYGDLGNPLCKTCR